jgi:hypothetical protein
MARGAMRRRRALVVSSLAFMWLSVSPALGATLPGNLPQTNVEPSFGAPLNHQMRTLFEAIATEKHTLGATVFFPRAAYLRMKTGVIPEPASDYAGRLVAFFNLDLAAYRRRLFTNSTTTFIRVNADPRQAAWIRPGACENRVGYWYLPRARLVMLRRHVVVSVAVASMISWRGVWYVIHLGPNPRPVNIGTVDGFMVGPGTPGPP